MRRPAIDGSWLKYLEAEFNLDYMVQLKQFLQQEKAQGKIIYPPGAEIFNALNSTPFDEVKVVIVGQDPYHGPRQAHGLSFSVQEGVALPPSLRNIYKELDQDLGIKNEPYGSLQSWADQGVLLLNAVLTVEQNQAASHQGKGWERFTDVIISALNEHRDGLVFILWGSYAQKKGGAIDTQRHTILKSPHPSPLSAHRGFFGCRHFSQTNQVLQKQGLEPINWALKPTGHQAYPEKKSSSEIPA